MNDTDYPARGPVARRSLIVLAALVLTGCGKTPAPTPAPEDAARQALDQALEAWKSGQTVAAVKEASPSILVADPDWEGGGVLKRFEVQGPGEPAGAERLFTVKLWLGGSEGTGTEQVVDYKVGTEPIVTVFRALF